MDQKERRIRPEEIPFEKCYRKSDDTPQSNVLPSIGLGFILVEGKIVSAFDISLGCPCDVRGILLGSPRSRSDLLYFYKY